jgi:predicted RNase H-like HicB family nuclease
MKRPTYAARVVRSGAWWAIDVPEIPGVHSQARRLDKVEYMTRDAIALWFEVPEDSFDLDVQVELPSKVREVVDAVDAARERSAAAQREESETLRAAADAMLGSGLTMRDAGRLLGVSHQRVAQLATRRRPTRRSPTRPGGGRPTTPMAARPGS